MNGYDFTSGLIGGVAATVVTILLIKALLIPKLMEDCVDGCVCPMTESVETFPGDE